MTPITSPKNHWQLRLSPLSLGILLRILYRDTTFALAGFCCLCISAAVVAQVLRASQPLMAQDSKPAESLTANHAQSRFKSQSFGATRLEQNYHLKENTDLRIRLQNLFTAPLNEVLASRQTIYSQRDGNPPVMFQVRLNNEQPDKLYYAFVNLSDDTENNTTPSPVSSRGSYLIRRNLQTDRIDQIKIFLNYNIGNEQSFIRISPKMNTPYSEIEVVIFDRTIYSGVPLSIPFADILTMPLHQFLQMTSETIPWETLWSDPTLTDWQLVKQIPQQLRPFLYQIPEIYDGAIDAHGLFVRIQTGEPLENPGMNCSGFVKWVADGVYRSLKRREDEQPYLDINVLRHRQTQIRGANNSWSDAKETTRDPYFGLDWARAIAQELLELKLGRPVDIRTSDVRAIPFFNYLENVGYPVANINAMMYLLAVKTPGAFYLGAINGTFGDPPLHQYYHEVVFFPYFKTNGKFELVIMDTGVERSKSFIEARYRNAYVHLSLINAPYVYQAAPLDLRQRPKE